MKTYKNISGVEQLDIPPGETGERELPQDQENRMVARGAIEVVSEAATDDAAASTSDPEKTPEEIEAERLAAEEAEKAERERVEAEQAEAKQRSGRGGRG